MDLFFDQEFRSIIPPLVAEEYEGLEASLLKEGNRNPIVIWKETKVMLDGHHRYDICHQHNIPLKPPLELSFPDRDAAKLWVIDNQLGRRNLPPYDRIALVKLRSDILALQQQARAHESLGGGDRKSDTYKSGLSTLTKAIPETPINIREEVARAARVSTGTVAKFDIIQKKATGKQKEKLRRGEATINQVHAQIRREETRAKDTNRMASLRPLAGEFNVLVADPPWPYHREEDFTHRAASPYSIMTIEQLRNLKLPAAPDSCLWLWATNGFLHEAFHLLEAWGFEYKTMLTWAKDKIGFGDWLRGQTEHCLLAVRGKYRLTPGNTSTLLLATRHNHSAKPEEFCILVEKLCPGTKVELFARKQRPGWEAWGAGLEGES